MTISSATWAVWLQSLEDMLHDADVAGADMFAIHINSAIEEAHSVRGTKRVLPRHDQAPPIGSSS